MMYPGRFLAFLFCLFASLASAWAALIIQAPSLSFPPGTNLIQVPIMVSGGDLVTDMVGVIQIGDGGPLVGGTSGPVITAVSYAGSIWAIAPGGFATTNTITLPAQIYDPNLSLNVPGQRVPGNGLLLTLTVDVSGFGPGAYPLRMGGIVPPIDTNTTFNTQFQNSGTNVPVNIINGCITLGAPATNAPALAIARQTNGFINLTFPSVFGVCYWVQVSTNLTAGSWIDVGNPISGTGGSVTWTDDGTSTAQSPTLTLRRFYRLRL